LQGVAYYVPCRKGITAGRSPTQDIKLIGDNWISREHFVLDCDDGSWTITDVDSMNGLMLNGVRLDSWTPSNELKNNDLISLGQSTFKFLADKVDSAEGYIIENWSKANCAEGTKPITDIDECVAAAHHHMTTRSNMYGYSVEYSYFDAPVGCSIMGDLCAGRFVFNRNPTGEAHNDFTPVCRTPNTKCKVKEDSKTTWGEYVIQDWQLDRCHPDTMAVTTLEECEYAARNYVSQRNEYEDRDKDFPNFAIEVQDVTDPDGPSGCTVVGDLCNGKFVFNNYDGGKAREGRSPVCIQSTAGVGQQGFMVVNKLLEFHSAELECQDLGGHLASARNRDEYLELRKLAMRHSKISGFAADEFWVGLHNNDKKTDGSFIWTDGTEFDPELIAFGKGEPSEWASKGGCVGLDKAEGWNMSAFPCDTKQAIFICRLPYALKRLPRSFEEAEAECKDGGGHLASASTKTQSEQLRKVAEAAGAQPTWIGLNDREREGFYTWTDGTEWNKKVVSVEKDYGASDKDCVAFLPKANYKLNNWDCANKAWYICKYPQHTEDFEEQDIGCGYNNYATKTKKKGKKYKNLESPCECRQKCNEEAAWTFYESSWKCQCFKATKDGAIKAKKTKGRVGSHNKTVKKTRKNGRI